MACFSDREEEEKRSWGSEQAGSPRHIACANKPSMCGEVLGQRHPPTVLLPEDEDARSTDDDPGKRRRTALTRRARLPFAPRPRHCPPQITVRAIYLGSDVDGPLRKGIFLTHFAQPEACSCWTTEYPVFAARVKASAPKRPVAPPNALAHCH
jgi:hypothetical protein